MDNLMDTYINLDRQYRKYNAQNENEFYGFIKIRSNH